MDNMPLFRRFIGSAIDKQIILFLFIVAFFIIDPHATVKIMHYLFTIMPVSPSLYHYTGEMEASFILFGFYNYGVSDYFQGYTPDMYERIVRTFDLNLTFSFIFLNAIYYILCEVKLKASLGKYLLGGILIDKIDDKITTNDIFVRAFSATTLMALCVGFRFLFDTNYFVTILLFFLANDIPVFIKGYSLIDMFTKVRYVRRTEFENYLNKP